MAAGVYIGVLGCIVGRWSIFISWRKPYEVIMAFPLYLHGFCDGTGVVAYSVV